MPATSIFMAAKQACVFYSEDGGSPWTTWIICQKTVTFTSNFIQQTTFLFIQQTWLAQMKISDTVK